MQKHKGAWEKGPPIAFNIGGYCLDIKRNTIMQAPKSVLARMSSGDWDHMLPRDAAGRIFLDLDVNWAKPIFQHLYQLTMVHDSDEPLNTPESSFEDSDDLMGYYVALDLFGLTNTFYPYVAEPAQMPLGMISQRLFIQKLRPVVQGCNRRADWHMVYKSSGDGYNRQAYQNCSKDKRHTAVFIRERGTGNVYGGYSAIARKYTVNAKWIDREQDPNMFLFTVTSAADCEQVTLSTPSSIHSNVIWLGTIQFIRHSALELLI
jgi:hypothetical protein